jgi:serine/threonine protein kinase
MLGVTPPNGEQKDLMARPVFRLNDGSTVIPTIIKQLGQGGHSQVFLGVHNGNEYCIKMLACPNDDPALAGRIMDEIKIMERLRGNTNICEMLSWTSRAANARSTEYFLLLELCAKGSLTSAINLQLEKATSFTERMLASMFEQVLRGVAVLHTSSPPVAHRDIKVENILIAADGTVKLIDFGSCTARAQVR